MTEPYTATAEFYDLLQATQHRELAERLITRWLGTPTVGVLDVGAGTGIATALLAKMTTVTVHAVEPAAPMRTVLLSRLAAQPDLLSRVRVHAAPIQELGLVGVADAAVCLNTMGCLEPAERSAVLGAIATALVPAAVFAVQRPPTFVAGVRHLPSWRFGGDVYDGEVASFPDGPDRVRWRFSYRVSHGGVVQRTTEETFTGYLTSQEEFDAELRRAGFTPSAVDDPDVVIARRDGDIR